MNIFDIALKNLDYESSTGNFIWKSDSRNNPRKGKVAGYKKDGYVVIETNRKAIRAHRLAWYLEYGEVPDEIDHINGIKSDNRISNLRKSNRNQNCYNRKARSDSGTGVKGVHFSKANGKFKADATVNKKRFHLGYFLTMEEAEKTVIKFREEHHKEFANHQRSSAEKSKGLAK